MDDLQIVEMYLARNENAIAESQRKYGRYLESLTNNVLGSNEDSEECVNDTYKRAWDTIPPKKPERLGAYLGKIARSIAINRYNFNKADKRNENLRVTLTEMEFFLPSPDFAEDAANAVAFSEAINAFLRGISVEKRNIFIQRYWYHMELKDIARENGMKESSVKVCLLRLRNDLKNHLEREGIFV